MRSAARPVGGVLLAVAAAWLAVSLAASTAVAAGAKSVQISGTGLGCTEFCYVPATLAAGSGDTVTWTNGSGAPHTITRCDAACSSQGAGTGGDVLSSSTVANGGTFNHTFSSPGTYFYYCTIHGYSVMHGEVDVAAAGTPAPTPQPTPKPTPAPTSRPTVAPTNTPLPTTSASAATTDNSPSPPAVTPPTDTATSSPGSTASAVLGTGAGAPGSTSGGLPVIAILVVLLLAAGGGYLFWRRRSQAP